MTLAAIKIAGPCDTTGCENDAQVHYGLEEFYCRPCDVKNAAWHREQHALVVERKWLAAIFAATWPKFCRSCGAWGVFTYYDNHGVPGPGEQISDACEKCEGKCPRCAYEIEVEEIPEAFEMWWSDAMPCPKCDWKWGENPGDTMPDFDGS